MIKTNSFVSVFLLSMLITFSGINISSNTAIGQTLEEISLPASEAGSRPRLSVDKISQVYLPSKLIIGQDNKFVIKGKPGSKVSLAVSSTDRGSEPLYGQELRLGETEQTIEGHIPASGILELGYPVPNDPNLVDKTKYFEVAIWTKEDFSDLELATTMGLSGRETMRNGVKIALPPASAKTPRFGAVLPGLPPELFESMENIKDAKEGKINPELLDNGEAPAYLDSPAQRDVMMQNLNRK